MDFENYDSSKVKLVASTPNPEGLVAYIARVSNPGNQSNPDYAKLIKYLLVNGHYSPFEHSYFTFRIVTSRAIAAQIIRHRSFTYQEFSQRYSVVDTVETIEIRRQATKNRQSSDEIFDPVVETIQHEREWDSHYDVRASAAIIDTLSFAMQTYHKLLEAGVAKEVARMVLPLATTTTIYMTGSIRSWIHYLALRTDEHTQKEHRLIAQAIEAELRKHLPTVFTAIDSIKADNLKDDLLLTLLREHKLTDADFLKKLLETDISIGLQNKA